VYGKLKRRLISEFHDDPELGHRVAAAHSLDELLTALAVSYRDALRSAAASASGSSKAANPDALCADRAADARERALFQIMTFFERDHARTATVEVRRTGPDGLRVIQRAPPEDGDVAASRVAGRALPNGAPCEAYQNRKAAS
jgi:hypothetical protein